MTETSTEVRSDEQIEAEIAPPCEAMGGCDIAASWAISYSCSRDGCNRRYTAFACQAHKAKWTRNLSRGLSRKCSNHPFTPSELTGVERL